MRNRLRERDVLRAFFSVVFLFLRFSVFLAEKGDA